MRRLKALDQRPFRKPLALCLRRRAPEAFSTPNVQGAARRRLWEGANNLARLVRLRVSRRGRLPPVVWLTSDQLYPLEPLGPLLTVLAGEGQPRQTVQLIRPLVIDPVGEEGLLLQQFQQ